jgi:multimeric flavodoxin WrbA
MAKKVIALLGTYRKSHVVEKIVDEILDELSNSGVETHKIFLQDKKIEFCTNCRSCTQEKGEKRGKCIHNDEMDAILDKIEECDSIVVASPVNFGNVTAITRRFMERLICYAYWPWGASFPRNRIKKLKKKALLITASGAPSFFVYLFMDVFKALKLHVKVMGAKSLGKMCMGFASTKENPELPKSLIKKARRLAKRLI